MLKIMFRKLRAKKWMSACLLAGILLMVATTVSFPLYRHQAFDRMLREEFRNALSAKGEWPGKNSIVLISKKEAGGNSIRRVEELMEEIYGLLGVTEKETVFHYSLAKAEAESLMERDDIGKLSLRPGFLSNLPEHAALLAGEMYSEDGISEDGCLEAVISTSCMVASNLLVGEVLRFPTLKDSQGEPLKIRITGVFGEGETQDFYWQKKPEEMELDCLISEEVFREYFTGNNARNYTITCSYYSLFEYEDLKASQVKQLMEQTAWLTEESPYRNTLSEPAYANLLEEYVGKQTRIQAMLFLLQIPVWILLGAFLLMLSGQMYDMEQNEIAVMKSRGALGRQILRLYFFQSVFLSLLGMAAGLPLGQLFAGVLGSARSFLEFDLQELSLSGTFGVMTTEAVIHGLGASAVCILIMVLPAVRHSRVTIVEVKRQKAAKKHSWWEKACVDLLCLAVALYGYDTCSRRETEVAASVLTGEAMDPLQYISAPLFIVGLGLLALRLQPLLVKGIFLLGRWFWRPASYISFMENEKNGRKQQFIMLFLILAIALGMFHATAARTILSNALKNEAYLDGADYIVREVWENNASQGGSAGEPSEFRYYEPDFGKYDRLEGVSSYTKVIYDDGAYVELSGNSRQDAVLMGIHTRQFGENTRMPPGLMEKPYYEYLNELAVNPDGFLVSSDFRDLLGMEIGDVISCCNHRGDRVSGKIVDFISYWPGFVPVVLEQNPDGTISIKSKSLIVAPVGTLNARWGTVPYEVWISASEGAEDSSFYSWIEEEDVRISRYVDRRADLEAVTKDPLLQGTNGILTMGFLVILILFAVGYLIFWILSIRSREMVFGILRAGGMYKREIFHILINEQIFCGGFSVAAGVAIGNLACRMFVPILQTAYSAADQVLPMRLITDRQDMVRLFCVIGTVLALCLIVLFGLVRKLNVAKALKLGEE